MFDPRANKIYSTRNVLKPSPYMRKINYFIDLACDNPYSRKLEKEAILENGVNSDLFSFYLSSRLFQSSTDFH